MENFDKLLLGYNGWVRFWRLHAYTHHFNESHKCEGYNNCYTVAT